MEEVLSERLKLKSLIGYMHDEGYEKHEVDDEANKADKRSLELMARAIARWKHGEENDKYLLPKMFDRWRQFVKMRKLVGFILRNMENRLQPCKADMSYAFNLWKYGAARSLAKLGGKTQAEKKVQMINNQKELEQLF